MIAALINVGANTATENEYRLQSPIFDDGSFEFVPITEHSKYCIDSRIIPRYGTIPLFNKRKGYLSDYLPDKFVNFEFDWDENKKEYLQEKELHISQIPAHNDPNFNNFTYGDYPLDFSRASNLQQLKDDKESYLFFLARLCEFIDNEYTGNAGFYLIGYLEIQNIYKNTNSKPKKPIYSKIKDNGHVIRGRCHYSEYDGFWIFKGSRNSKRFKYAVPFSFNLGQEILRDTEGKKWKRLKHKGFTELGRIGSYTRSCRIIENKDKIARLWKEFERYN